MDYSGGDPSAMVVYGAGMGMGTGTGMPQQQGYAGGAPQQGYGYQ